MPGHQDHGQLAELQRPTVLGANLRSNLENADPLPALICAVYENDRDLVDGLLLSGADPNVRDVTGESALCIAAKRGLTEIAELLLQRGAQLSNDGKPEEHSALVLAASAGHLEIARLIMATGKASDRLLALSKAIRHGHLAVVKELIQLPLDAGVEHAASDTSFLDLAIDGGHLDIVEYFLSKDFFRLKMKRRWTSPLSRAAAKGSVEIIQRLVVAGADLVAQNPLGNTPLMVACYNRQTAAAIYLSAHMSHEDIDIRNDNSMTALHYAIYKLDVNTVKHLLMRGADSNLAYRDTLTPLHIAIISDSSDIATCLLMNDDDPANPDFADGEGNAPIHLATDRGFLSLIKDLAKAGADIDKRDAEGLTSLQRAVRNGASRVVEMLLDHGSNPDLIGPLGLTALHMAASQGSNEMVQLLFGEGANVNRQAFDGTTALHQAAANLHADVVDTLVNAGADQSIIDKYGHSAFTYASHRQGVSEKLKQPDDATSKSLISGISTSLRSLIEYNKEVIRAHFAKRVWESGSFTLQQVLHSLLAAHLLLQDFQTVACIITVWPKIWELRFNKELSLTCRGCGALHRLGNMYQCQICFPLMLCSECQVAHTQTNKEGIPPHRMVQVSNLGGGGAPFGQSSLMMFKECLPEPLFTKLFGNPSLDRLESPRAPSRQAPSTSPLAIAVPTSLTTERDFTLANTNKATNSRPSEAPSRSIFAFSELWPSLEALNQAIQENNALVTSSNEHDRELMGFYWTLLQRSIQRWQMTKRLEDLQALKHLAEKTVIQKIFTGSDLHQIHLLSALCWYWEMGNTEPTILLCNETLRVFLYALFVLTRGSNERNYLLCALVRLCRTRYDMDDKSFPALHSTISLLEESRLLVLAYQQSGLDAEGAVVVEYVDFVLADLHELNYNQDGPLESLNKAILHLRNIVNGDTTALVEYPGRLVSLYDLLEIKFRREDSIEALVEGIALLRRYLKIIPEPHYGRATALNNLAYSLRQLHSVRRNTQSLDEAVDLVQEALQIISQYATEKATIYRGVILRNYGSVLRNRYEESSEPGDLEKSIEALKQALTMGPLSDEDRVDRLSELAKVYNSRFTRSQSSEDLNLAMGFAKQAVMVRGCKRGTICQVLQTLCQTLFQQASRHSAPQIEYDRIVRLAKINVGSQLSPFDRALEYHNLSTYLIERYKRFHTIDDLQQSIAHELRCLRLLSVTDARRPVCLSGLGHRFEELYEHSKKASDLEAAIGLHQVAVRMNPNNDIAIHNLAAATMRHWRLTNSPDSLNLTTDRFEARLRLASAPILSRVRGGNAAALFALELNDWNRAALLCQEVVKLLPDLYGHLTTREDLQHVLGLLTNLSERIVTAFLGAGKSLSELFEHVESTRGITAYLIIVARNISATNNAALACLPDLAPSSKITPATLPPKLGEEEIVVETTPAYQLRSTVSVNEAVELAAAGPIVDFAVTHVRSDAILITEQGVSNIRLGQLHREDLDEAVALVVGEGGGSSEDVPVDRFERSRKLKRLLLWLWRVAIKPVLCELKLYASSQKHSSTMPHVRWISSSLMGILPLHAAGNCRIGTMENTMDQVVSSYISSVKGLRYAETQRRICLTDLQKRALFVGMPRTPGNWRPIDVQHEHAALAAFCPQAQSLMNPSAADVVETMRLSNICHFACHGLMDSSDPSNSRLILGLEQEDPLTVKLLADKFFARAHLIYLAACSTAGNPAQNLVSESLHLAGAFQLIGFPNVIGALWEVDTHPASIIASEFYKNLSEIGPEYMERGKIAHALHQAVASYRQQHDSDPLAWAPQIHYGV